MPPINIGLDLGSTGVRAAAPTPTGGVAALDVALNDLLLCEQSAANGLGVDFPGLKGILGSDTSLAVDDRVVRPSELLSQVLLALRAGLERETGGIVGQAAIAVPARYTTAQRTDLREAALEAGFAGVHLLSDSACAVIAHTADSDTWQTVLVYALGYSGLELALVRGRRGHLRVLGYEGDTRSGGRMLDQVVLEMWFDAFRRRGLRVDTREWTPATWMTVRGAAQAAKEQLSRKQRATLALSVGGTDGRSQQPPTLTRTAFEQASAAALDASIDQIRALLEQTSSTAQDIEAVLLVGGSTLIPSVRDAVARELDREPVSVEADALARGAALHALRLTTAGSVDGLEDAAVVAAQQPEAPPRRGRLRRPAATDAQPPGKRPRLLATRATDELDSGDEGAAPDGLPTLGMLEDYARRLAADGRADAAGERLRDLVRDAGTVLEELAALVPTVPRMAAEALTLAEAFMDEGRHDAAVAHSHLAWEHARDNPEVFDKMIDVHCRAAMASSGYEETVQWLTCAYGHDQSNERVRGLLADRHYAHAKELGERRRPRDALRAIDAALRWSPDHPGAHELQRTLRHR